MDEVKGYLEYDGKILKIQFVEQLQDFMNNLEEEVEEFDDSYVENEDDYYNEWDDYGTSGEKYGYYNGYSDDVIDDAFDGCPEATWNVD